MGYKGQNAWAGASAALLIAATVSSACTNDDSSSGSGGEAGEAIGGGAEPSIGGTGNAAAGSDAAGAERGTLGGAAGSNRGPEGGAGQGGDGGTGGEAVSPLQITTIDLLDARVNQPYSQRIEAEGGSGAGYVFEVSDGTLPIGISLSATGVLTGRPAVESSGTFSVRVTDSAGAWSAASFSLRVAKHRWGVFSFVKLYLG